MTEEQSILGSICTVHTHEETCDVHICSYSHMNKFKNFKPLVGVVNKLITLIYCPSPRKSLVKGERFIRFEERPEHVKEHYKLLFILDFLKTLVVDNILLISTEN